MRRRARPALLLFVGAGCGVYGPGLPAPQPHLDAAPPDAPVMDAEEMPDRRPDIALPDRLLDLAPPAGIAAAPALVGCADGTREGFASLEDWPAIAGCSGAWQVPGSMGLEAREARCGRAAGNSGARGDGQGCSVADLCAEGWHVCRDAAEVDRTSPSGCEGALAPGEGGFFIVAAGASPQGICLPDPAEANDLHGCGDGSLGLPEAVGCEPLERRMGFAECAATGVWSCGSSDDHLREASLVTKRESRLGGVLCCRD